MAISAQARVGVAMIPLLMHRSVFATKTQQLVRTVQVDLSRQSAQRTASMVVCAPFLGTT